jgi:hypothetical protein
MNQSQVDGYNRGANYRHTGNQEIDNLRWDREVIQGEPAQLNSYYEEMIKSDDNYPSNRGRG